MAELKKATKDFGEEMVIGDSFGKVVKGYINPKTLSPGKEEVGMAIAVKRFHLTNEQALQDWLDLLDTHSLVPNMQEFNAKVSYFGLKWPPSHDDGTYVSSSYADEPTRFHYAPPEYICSGKLHMSGDVYSFGVILLEILTCFGKGRIVQVKQEIRNDKENIAGMIDPDLKNSYPLEAGRLMCEIIKQCLEEDPEKRPSMLQVLEIWI